MNEFTRESVWWLSDSTERDSDWILLMESGTPRTEITSHPFFGSDIVSASGLTSTSHTERETTLGAVLGEMLCALRWGLKTALDQVEIFSSENGLDVITPGREQKEGKR